VLFIVLYPRCTRNDDLYIILYTMTISFALLLACKNDDVLHMCFAHKRRGYTRTNTLNKTPNRFGHNPKIYYVGPMRGSLGDIYIILYTYVLHVRHAIYK
jgi:hypothetical protein